MNSFGRWLCRWFGAWCVDDLRRWDGDMDVCGDLPIFWIIFDGVFLMDIVVCFVVICANEVRARMEAHSEGRYMHSPESGLPFTFLDFRGSSSESLRETEKNVVQRDEHELVCSTNDDTKHSRAFPRFADPDAAVMFSASSLTVFLERLLTGGFHMIIFRASSRCWS